MTLKRWTLAFGFLLPLLGVMSLTGCGEAPSDAPQQTEQTQEELDAYNQRMRETGGRG